MYLCELGKDWQLRHEELYWDRDHYAAAMGRQTGWLDVETLPCDVHVPLIKAGVTATAGGIPAGPETIRAGHAGQPAPHPALGPEASR